MPFLKKFIKLMKNELFKKSRKKGNFSWVIDENKCLNIREVRKLRKTCNKAKDYGLEYVT